MNICHQALVSARRMSALCIWFVPKRICTSQRSNYFYTLGLSQYPIQCININGSKNYDLADILEHFNKYIFSVDKRIIKILQLMRLMKKNKYLLNHNFLNR
jgi:hypothetical protein